MKSIDAKALESATSEIREQSNSQFLHEDETLFRMSLELLANLWRWHAMVLFIVLVGLAATWLNLQTIPSRYIARAEVLFDFSRQSFVSDLPDTAVAPSSAALNTEMEILGSRRLMGIVVEALSLVEDPEFNPWLTELAEPTESWLRRMSQSEVPALYVSEPPTEAEIHHAAVSNLLSSVSVRLVPDSYVFSITVESLSAEKSAAIANDIARLFIEERSQRRLKASEDAIFWLERRTAALQDRLREAEGQVAQQRALSAPGTDSFLASSAIQIASMRERLTTLDADTVLFQDLLADLEIATATGLVVPEAIARTRRVSNALANKLEYANGASASEFTKTIEAVRAAIVSSRQVAADDAAQVEYQLKELLEAYSTRTTEMHALRNAEREAAASLAAYEGMLERLKNRIAVGALDPFFSEATVISPAVPPDFPASPERELIFALAGIGSLAVASGIALVLNALFPVVSSTRELERIARAPVVAQLPLPANGNLVRLQKKLSDNSSRLAEGFRTLRGSIAVGYNKSPPLVILLTSSDELESTRTMGHLLGRSFAQIGKKSLVADLIPAGSGKSQKAKSSLNLKSVLLGETNLSQAISVDPTTGVGTLNAAQDLADDLGFLAYSSKRVGFNKVAEGFDFVIVVTPPVSALPDVQILSRLSDVVLLTVRRNSSRPATVRGALDLLVRGGGHRFGTVMLSRRAGH
ncbi:MAG: hypothetical protein AAGA12_14530 [Pseudomonadota bacterium]